MRRLMGVALLFVLLEMAMPSVSRAQEQPGVAITFPAAGQPVQGLVTIAGTAAAAGFQRYELAFAYDPDPTGTWFSIGERVTAPVEGGALGLWDTTGLTDGQFALRLRVYTGERTFVETVVRGIRVANNVAPPATPTPTPTVTPSPTATMPLGPTVTAIAVGSSTATDPQNPLLSSGANAVSFASTVLATAQYEAAFWDGVTLSFALFSILGVYLGIRVALRHFWRRDRSG
jgi:hypothetical protein